MHRDIERNIFVYNVIMDTGNVTLGDLPHCRKHEHKHISFMGRMSTILCGVIYRF